MIICVGGLSGDWTRVFWIALQHTLQQHDVNIDVDALVYCTSVIASCLCVQHTGDDLPARNAMCVHGEERRRG